MKAKFGSAVLLTFAVIFGMQVTQWINQPAQAARDSSTWLLECRAPIQGCYAMDESGNLYAITTYSGEGYGKMHYLGRLSAGR